MKRGRFPIDKMIMKKIKSTLIERIEIFSYCRTQSIAEFKTIGVKYIIKIATKNKKSCYCKTEKEKIINYLSNSKRTHSNRLETKDNSSS